MVAGFRVMPGRWTQHGQTHPSWATWMTCLAGFSLLPILTSAALRPTPHRTRPPTGAVSLLRIPALTVGLASALACGSPDPDPLPADPRI